MKLFLALLIGLLLFQIVSLTAQSKLGTSQLYEITYAKNGDRMQTKGVRFLTAFNPNGYNDQVRFYGSDKALFTSDYNTPGKTDIWSMDLDKNELERVTQTDADEYSPTGSPKDFEVVLVPEEGNQTFHRYKPGAPQFSKRLFNKKSTFCYFQPINDEEWVFVLNPNNLTLAHGRGTEDKMDIILDRVGRCLQQGPDGQVYFVHKYLDDLWSIKSYDPESGQITKIIHTVKGSEDFTILADGSLLMGNKSKLYLYDPATGKEWKEVADFSEYGLLNITRLAANKNKIILTERK